MPLTRTAILVNLWVPGRPRPKGSLKNVAKRGQPARLVEEVEGSEAWKRRVRNAVVRHVRGDDAVLRVGKWEAVTLPVEVDALFCFTPPADPANGEHPIGMEGDLDKLIRNVGDALTESGLIKDDRQIVCWRALKRFTRVPLDTVDGAETLQAPYAEGLLLSVGLAR